MELGRIPVMMTAKECVLDGGRLVEYDWKCLDVTIYVERLSLVSCCWVRAKLYMVVWRSTNRKT